MAPKARDRGNRGAGGAAEAEAAVVAAGERRPEGGVPFLTEDHWLGWLLGELFAACVGAASVEIGSRPDGRAYATLRAMKDVGLKRTWEGELVAEVVGAALLARWAAMSRKPASP